MTGDLYGDFSRLTFAPEKHFSAVLLQQGRVVLDADVNEQTAIMLHRLRTLGVDLIGPYGGPKRSAGFEISLDASMTPGTLRIGPGRYYVHGLVCEVDEPTTYFAQPEAYLDPDDDRDQLPRMPYVVYVKVWERHITAAEDPSISELALGGNGDTAVRSKIVWQVLASHDWPPGSGASVGNSRDAARKRWGDWEEAQIEHTPSGGRIPMLRARARQPTESLDPNAEPHEARYRGLENQLYRVEVHRSGTAGTATFKWSRDNGSVVYPLESFSGEEAIVLSLSRDPGPGLEVGDWVEILDDRSVLRGEREALRRVDRIEPLDRAVILDQPSEDGVGRDPDLHPFLRRWDQKAAPQESGYAADLPGDSGVLELIEGPWIELENGIEIQFDEGGEYAAGDYWLIAARAATGDVEWPQGPSGPAFRHPVGIQYFYAPLAYVDPAGNASDMRSTFGSLSNPTP
jgi:hypothetical protein